MRKDKYYIYPRDNDGNPTGHTIAVILRDGMIFHGISLCGEKDQFSYKKGRSIALNRAEHSYEKHLKRKADQDVASVSTPLPETSLSTVELPLDMPKSNLFRKLDALKNASKQETE